MNEHESKHYQLEKFCKERWKLTIEQANLRNLLAMYERGYLETNASKCPKRYRYFKEIVEDPILHEYYQKLADSSGTKFPSGQDTEHPTIPQTSTVNQIPQNVK